MALFEIYFHGLICFFAPEQRYGPRNYKTDALIVKDPDHQRYLFTSDGNRLSITNSLSIGTAGRATSDDSRFQQFVPHLGDLAVTREAVSVVPGNGGAIRVSLPNGSLSVAQLYYTNLGVYELDGNTNRQAVSRISLLSINTANDDRLPIIVDGNTIYVPPGDNAWAVIFNGSVDDPKKTGVDNHFHRYGYITNRARLDDVAEVTDYATAVPEGRSGVHRDEAIRAVDGYGPLNQTQCSNSQWP